MTTLRRRFAAVVAGCLFAWSAHGAVLQVQDVTASPGLSVQVPVQLSSAAGQSVAGLQFDVLYDTAAVIINSVGAGPAAVNAGKTLSSATPATGRLRVLISGLNENVIANGTVAVLSIVVRPGATGAQTGLALASVVLSSPAGTAVPVTPISGTITIGQPQPHSADTNRDWIISLSETLRVVQLFRLGQYSCLSGTEDGYAPGIGPRDCVPHDSDYVPAPNWEIDFSELLRLIQFFNAQGYERKLDTEDGFSPRMPGMRLQESS